MPRLIDAEKLMPMIPTEEYNARIAITYAPTVDAVEVVRCKDCESWGLNAIKKDEKGEVIYGDCLHFCVATPKWFYCAWGVRKNGQ